MTSDDFSHSFTHPPIVPFFSFSKNCFFISSLFLPLFPPALHALPHSILSLFSSNPLCPLFNSSPHIPQFLCTSRILQNVLFTTPNPFIARSFSSLKSLHGIPLSSPLSLPAVLYAFFPSLHTHASSSDSHFTVIYGNPSSKSSSQR